jgi:2-polyprenyl-6-methoxyphenol hydroxylase-like FAD-dependent oxidoreductase
MASPRLRSRRRGRPGAPTTGRSFGARSIPPSGSVASNRSSWGSDALETYDFLREPYGHGWHLDRRRFDAMLAGEAVRSGCTWMSATRVERIERRGDGWRLTASAAEHTSLRARFLIDATGRRSRVARSQGARRCVYDQLVALVAFLVRDGEAAVDTTTLVEAVADGWWYSARLPDGRLVCTFMTDADLLRQNGGSSLAAWQARLHQSVHTRARVEGSRCRLAGPPAVAASGEASPATWKCAPPTTAWNDDGRPLRSGGGDGDHRLQPRARRGRAVCEAGIVR